MTIRVALAGASGRLGRAAAAVIDAAAGFEVVARLGSRDDLETMLGSEEEPSQVVLDTTLPEVSPGIVAFALEHDRSVVVGTSGWSQERIDQVVGLLPQHPQSALVIVPNFSLGSTLGTVLAAVASRFFDAAEIIEAHAASKSDSPSGTAVRTAELMQRARGERGPVAAPHTDQRARGQQVATVPIHSVRLPGLVAQQQVIFGGTGETLSITHNTISNDSYSAGILLALKHASRSTGLTVGLDALLGLNSLMEA